MTEISETGLPYVPVDYEGPTTPCVVCGNTAPVRWPHDGSEPPVEKSECSPCFIGRIANELVTLREAQALKAEIQKWEKP